MLVWAVGIVPAAFAIASATGAFEHKTRDPVLTQRVILGSVEESVLANGVLEPLRQVSVGAQTSGQLKTLHVKLGQAVKSGDLIAEIDPTKEQHKLLTAQANLASANAERKAAGIRLKGAELEFLRQKTLSRNKAGSVADLEKAQAAFFAQEATVEQVDAQIDEKTLAVEEARATLDHTKLSAPMDGVVVAVLAQEGQTLNSSQDVPSIVILAQLDVMRVSVQISEIDIARVKPGQNLRFRMLGGTPVPISGVLEEIEPAPPTIADERTPSSEKIGAAAVYYNGLFSTPNPEGRLRPKMNALVWIISGQAENVPLVVWSALTEPDANGRYRVQVRTPTGELTERLVTIGLTDKIKAQVLDGLSVGDEVVIPAVGRGTNVEAP
ncbi:efflux RND transporter periplasmic adaptor subunit [Mesorhizobium neociceri]|uniref:efflux RND transporter periplasmic adaptor subunit n=1 Tax=Mesorhizobium neociceri TaxID=1307853 RepID=UPI002E29CDA6|nr:efflux RND transporter periplasmic adaptor subunit [Mesorhizobium neociceri]